MDATEINTLIDRTRIRGAARMIPQGTEAKDVTPEQIQTVAGDVDLFCRNNGITRKAVALAVGYSPGVISEFLKGQYQGNCGQVAIDLEDWLVEEEQRRNNQQKTVFTWTNVAQQIQEVAQYCLDFKKIGLVYGPETSGLGKTTALKAIAQELGPRRSTYITINKCDASPTALLQKILEGLGMRHDQKSNNAQRFGRIVEELTGRSHILLIDQIHNLRFSKEDKPFYSLADLFDATGTAQLWCGTSDMVNYLQKQQSRTVDEPLAQIRRRIFPCIDLMATTGPDGNGEPLVTVDQIREMFSRFKLRLTTPGARWLCTLARVSGSGSLGTCVNVMEYAVMLGLSRKATSLDVPLLKQSLQCGLTAANASKVLAEVERLMESETRIAKSA